MRILLLPFLIIPSLAQAAYIEGDTGFACYDMEYQHRVDRMIAAGDRDAAKAVIDNGLRSGECAALPAGLRVRIEQNSFPYACVAKFGTAARCLWVRQRNVNPKE